MHLKCMHEGESLMQIYDRSTACLSIWQQAVYSCTYNTTLCSFDMQGRCIAEGAPQNNSPLIVNVQRSGSRWSVTVRLWE